MRYNQPYGAVTNAPFVNGDPSVGRAGSIPPAESMEYPQREIVNFITDSGITPSNTDLTQLAKSVQSGTVNYALDAGTQNALAVTLLPAPDVILPGFLVRLKIKFDITGPSTLNVGTGIKPIVRSDGTPTVLGDGIAGEIAQFIFDGTSYQKQGLSLSGGPGVLLTAARTYYVNGTIGSDTLYDGTTATVSAPHGPFATVQKACNTVSFLNANGFIITISVANGTYASFGVVKPTNGSLRIIGNAGSPASCTILTNTVQGGCISVAGTGVTAFTQGFKLINNTAGGNGFLAQAGGHIDFQDIDFGLCAGSHFFCDVGTMTCFGNYSISGAAVNHIQVSRGEFILTPSGFNTVTCSAVNVGTFCNCFDLSFVRCNTRTTFANSGAIVAVKFNVASLGLIESGGSGFNFFPGTVAGTGASGGVYV